ncbi:MAG: DUF4368 domain-containing protein, partial [Clostridia bacterium]|nr:DUF4368 domain-containing protein [Clostridia bacterium]
ACRQRMSELEIILKKLYEDNVFGKISDGRFAVMSSDYEAEAKRLKDRYNELQGLLDAYGKQSRDAREFARLVEQYTDITELTEELLHTLIDRVVVHEKEAVNGEIIMRVDIYYRFIGRVGDTEGKDLRAAHVRRNNKMLVEAGVIPAETAKAI